MSESDLSRSTSTFDGDETRTGASRASVEQEESYLKLIAALSSQPEPERSVDLIATIARWAPYARVIAAITQVPAWFGEWHLREALYGNSATDPALRDRIANCIAVFELVCEMDRPGLAEAEKAEIKDEVKSQIASLEEADRTLLKARLKARATPKREKPERPPEPPPVEIAAGPDPVLQALLADLAAAAQAEAAEPPPPEAASNEMFGMGGDFLSGVIERDEVLPPPAPAPPAPAPPAPPAPKLEAPAPVVVPPPAPPPAPAPAPEKHYIILDGERIEVDGPPQLAASPAALPPPPPAKSSPPPPPREAEPFEIDVATVAIEPFDLAPPPPPKAKPAAKPPAPPIPPASPPVAPPPPRPTVTLSAEERAELDRLPVDQQASLASMTDRAEILSILIRSNEDRVFESVLDNPHVVLAVVSARAPRMSAKQVKVLLRKARWAKKGPIQVGLLANPSLLRDQAHALLQQIEEPGDLLDVMRSSQILSPQTKQLAKDRLVQRYWAMATPARVKTLRGLGRAVFEELWEQIFRDETTLADLLKSEALETDIVIQIATSPLAPRALLQQIAAMPSALGNAQICDALLRNPKTPRSVLERLVKKLSPDERKKMKNAITLPPTVRELLK